LAGLNALALPSYEKLAAAGAAETLEHAPVVAAFDRPEQAAALRHELHAVAATGQEVSVDELSAAELHREQPLLSARATWGLRIGGQRYVQPLVLVRSLAAAVAARGGTIATGVAVRGLASQPGGAVRVAADRGGDYAACVLAGGAWIGELARPAGVRVRVLAGRGYSFTVRTPEPLIRPLYLPPLRVACTPASGGMRVAGTMEFRRADDPLDRRRIAAIARSARDYLPAVDWSERSAEWVGPRPVTADGLPVIGSTAMPGVFVAGGHGMWGMTLGPATGHLLARFIATGRRPDALAPFDPGR
jgi:D-amino-acid dehydrogenase